MENAFDSYYVPKQSKEDQIICVYGHLYVGCQVTSRRIRLRIVGYMPAGVLQFADKARGAIWIVSCDVVADFIKICDSARTEPDSAHLSDFLDAYFARSLAKTVSASTEGPLSIPS